VRAVFRDRIGVRPGDRLPVTVNPRNVHIFDKVSGLPL
jgi:multiple sugar transport system ATP-binding protein